MSKRSLKRIICLLLGIVLVCASATSVPAVAASAKDKELQSQIDQLEAKSKELEAEIKELKKDKSKQKALKNALQKKIDNVQSEINLCNSKINGYQTKIKESEAIIAKKNAEMEDNIDAFKSRMRIIYMTGNGNGEVNILLGADDFSDFLTLSALTGKVSARDKALMEDIKEEIKEVKAQEEVMKTYISEQNEVKKTLASKKSVLDADMSEHDEILDELNADQKKLEKENKIYEKAIQQIEDEIAGKNKEASQSGVVYDGGQFIWPTPGYYKVYSGYGQRRGKLHKGIDISQSGINGARIVASASGVVIAAGWNSGGYGNYVMINHGTLNGKTYITLYAHLSKVATRVGANVSKGQYIGNVGSTGRSSGPHLHYEIRVNGSPKNPMSFFSKVK